MPGTHHVGAPGAEVLNPAGADAGVVEVDPVVGERLLVVDHERDQAQRAVAQAFRGLDDLLRRSGVEDQHELAERDARQHGVDRHFDRPPVVLHRHSDDGVVVVVDRQGAVMAMNGDAAVGHAGLERLPHLPGSEARVVELLDQRRRLPTSQVQRREQGLPEREVLDPLHSPLGVDLRAGHAPHLLRVRAEEHVVDAVAEVDGGEVLERLDLVAGRREAAAEIRQRTQGRFEEAQPGYDVTRLERVREVLAVVVDA